MTTQSDAGPQDITNLLFEALQSIGKRLRLCLPVSTNGVEIAFKFYLFSRCDSSNIET